MYIVVLTLLLAKTASGLLGYDCGGTSFNVTTVSLLEVGECHSADSRPNSTSVYIQLLQIADYSEIRTMSCKIEIDRQMFYCGMHSHISMVLGGHRKYLLEIEQHKCSRLHETGSIVLGNAVSIIGLLPNSTNYRVITLAGTTNMDGSCKGGDFSDPYGTWNNVVVEASVTITLRDYYASAKTKMDYITLRSGVQCTLSKNECIDEDGANVFWAPLPVEACNFRAYNVLYQGQAYKIYDSNTQYPIVYSLTTKDITFALSKRSEYNVCGFTLIQTEHPKLLIVETNKNNLFVTFTQISVSNLDIFTYINSKFVYVEKHLKTQMQDLYRNILDQKCRLERQVLKNAISIAHNQPDVFAYNLMKGPGYMATISGEVAHIIKCVPNEVTRRSTENCYLELPVLLQNKSMYLVPKTHILISSGTPVDCNPLLPIMYKIKGGWISLTPRPAAIQSPQIMEPMTKPVWKYIEAEHLSDSGIYSQEDLSRLRDHIMFPVESTALLNTFARTAAGHRVPLSGISLTGFLDEETLDKIATSTGEKLWGGFVKFGTASAGFIGIWMLIRLIKLIADTAIHGYALHSVYGWSLHLLGAIFSSITNLLLHLGRRNQPKSSPQSPEGTTTNKQSVHVDQLPVTTPAKGPTPRPLYPTLSIDMGDPKEGNHRVTVPRTTREDNGEHNTCSICKETHQIRH